VTRGATVIDEEWQEVCLGEKDGRWRVVAFHGSRFNVSLGDRADVLSAG
jgi:hypothetical protein